ncbi:MAG TPA: CHAT domain-containing protein [Chitinophagaceae bacterium]|nr:CHAT domain-containing protein [Chitinophagaceae bacterium]
MRLLLSIVVIIIFSLKATSQKNVSTSPNNELYQIAEDQIQQLFRARGLSDGEILPFLEQYRDKNILSDNDLAALLNKIYPSNYGIGVILYFFNNDTLQRVFLEPGKAIEHEWFAIKKEEILQTINDINIALKLKERSGNRAPKKRGLILENEKTTKPVTYKEAIDKASTLLIPKSFNEKFKHLLIIPALNIGTLPFALLKPFKKEKLLIDQCSYTIVPSLADLIILRTRVLKNKNFQIDMNKPFDTLSNKRFLSQKFELEKGIFLSNPTYPVNTDFVFPDLPGTKKEVTVAKNYVKYPKVFEGPKAIKDSIIKYMTWKENDILYFATHGIADEKEPLDKSFLVLSGNNPFLTAREIVDFRKADSLRFGFPPLVILSACQTGLGKAMEAGILGLARGFLISGSHHVIMSLWNVDDNATAYLMNRFMYHLKNPNLFSPSEPLRLAMLDTRKKYPDPLLWSSFSLFGIDY